MAKRFDLIVIMDKSRSHPHVILFIHVRMLRISKWALDLPHH
jgi:hypothetical protein